MGYRLKLKQASGWTDWFIKGLKYVKAALLVAASGSGNIATWAALRLGHNNSTIAA